MLRFESTLAFRHLRSGRGQTLLTISAVASGVMIVVFFSSLVFGIRTHAERVLTDILPHVKVTVPDLLPARLGGAPGAGESRIRSRVERQSQQRKQIESWPRVQSILERVPGVEVVAPVVWGQGFVSRGGEQVGTPVYGADPNRLNRVMPVSKYLYAGHYLGLRSGEIVLAYQAAHDLGVAVGERVRLTSSEGLSDSFLVVGLYDSGQDITASYITLRAAQSLYATGTGVPMILVKADNLFHADQVADRIMALLPYEAKSWSRQYPQFVTMLGAYDAVALLVSAFSLVAAAFSIASVLIVSVVQKGKQIGILKSIGARSKQILTVFLLEGLGIALLGSSAGAVLGCGIIAVLGFFKQPVTRVGATPEQMFPSHLTWQLVAIAILASVLTTVVAAALPAWRAARLDPVEAIR